MEGLRLAMRAVCLSVVAVGLAVPGAFGQALPTPAAPTLSNNTTNGGIDATFTPPTRTSNTLYAITVRDEKQHVVTKKTVPVLPAPQQITANLTDMIMANMNYSVTVQTQNSTSTSAESPAATILTLPAPPTNIAGVGGLQKVTVSWTAAAGATSYQLTVSNGMSFTTSATTYVVTGLQTATSYNVIVASINAAGGRGVFSPAVAVRTANVALQ